MSKKSFVMYESWGDMITALPDDQALSLTRAIIAYQKNGNCELNNPVLKAYFETNVRPCLDDNNRKYQEKLDTMKKLNEKRNDFVRDRNDNARERNDFVRDRNDNVLVDVDEDVNEDVDVDVKEKEGEESKEKRPSAPIREVVEAYNKTCVSFPAVKSLSESRKKAIRARLKTYSLGDFQAMFEKAEKSDFLKGENQRNWSANFDWMIKDSNFAKILDGNYDNDKGKAHLPRGDDKFSAIRQWAEEKGVKVD
jgi:hypothetical protein